MEEQPPGRGERDRGAHTTGAPEQGNEEAIGPLLIAVRVEAVGVHDTSLHLRRQTARQQAPDAAGFLPDERDRFYTRLRGEPRDRSQDVLHRVRGGRSVVGGEEGALRLGRELWVRGSESVYRHDLATAGEQPRGQRGQLRSCHLGLAGARYN